MSRKPKITRDIEQERNARIVLFSVAVAIVFLKLISLVIFAVASALTVVPRCARAGSVLSENLEVAMQGEIASVNPEDLRKVWEAFPLMREQHAGGPSNREMVAKLAPGADFLSLIAHCAVLKNDIDCGKIDPKAIDFVEAAKPIPLSL